jgi:hypothetical protein
MLTRIYIIAGALLLGGYGVAAWEGWEFSNPRVLTPAPPAGAALSPSSGRAHYSGSSSGSRSGWIIWGGK